MERANSVLIDSHFVAGVDIFRSVHLLHQHQFSLPTNHTLSKNYCRKRRLSKHGHSFPSGQIASYDPSGDALLKKTRDIIIFFYSLVLKPLHLLCDGNHTKFLSFLTSYKQCFHRASLEIFHLPLLDSLCFQMEN